MAVSMRDLDVAFLSAGQKGGVEIWRIENFHPISVSKSSYGKFFTGDSYIILKTTVLKSGSLRHDIHYWLGKDTSQDEAGIAAVKTVELDSALGGRTVQYREMQGYETEKFLSYFKPCIIPQEGGAASGYRNVRAEAHKTRLYICIGKHVVRVEEVPFARSSLNHDDIFVLDTMSKIFQFNGSNSCIQERAKALEVMQFIKDTYHDGKCEVAVVEDGQLMADAESGEFWAAFGGFAPLLRKGASKDDSALPKLMSVEKGEAKQVQGDSLKRELLDTNKCYILDCGSEIFVWMGRVVSLHERKSASRAAEDLVRGPGRPKSCMIRVTEGFETAMFRSKFDTWPQASAVAVSEDGRGKVAALLKRQGINVKGLLKAAPAKEEPQPYIDCTGNLQVWRVNGNDKTLLSAFEQSRFYSGDCYIFQYSYPGEEKDETLIGTWFGKQSIEEERASSVSLASKVAGSLKNLPAQARIYEGSEPILFCSIFQIFIIYKGGLSNVYKSYISENEFTDETYKEDGVALFRVQGNGPDNMQAIQVEPIASNLNSSYCYILHSGSSVFTWSGSLTTSDDQELVERQLDLIKPNTQSKPQKEGIESEQFWDLLGGKSEHPSQKIGKEAEGDPHLFSCIFSKGHLKVTEIFNFTQDDLMTEDISILDCHSEFFVWVGQQVDSKTRMLALTIGEKFLEHDFLLERLSREAPLYVVMEGSEPTFFTRFFTWDYAKSTMHGNSFQRKLMIMKTGSAPAPNKPKRRIPVLHGGRSSVPDKSQRSRSMSFSPDRVRVRGRSPAFNALAANFENPSSRNLSTPPPVVRKSHSRSLTPDSYSLAPRSKVISALTARFDNPAPAREKNIPCYVKVTSEAPESKSETNSIELTMSSRIESLTIKDVKGETGDENGFPIYPYERLIVLAADPATEIDVTKRETYLSSEEFQKKFGMVKSAFHKLPKWKQNKLKMALQLF